MDSNNFKTSDDLLCYAKNIEGFSISETVVSYDMTYNGKGRLGQLVEEVYFGFKNNNRKEADFKNLGIELKVAPLKRVTPKPSNESLRLRMGISAKERISVSMINYCDLVNEEWETASIHEKLKMLLMFYFHENCIPVDQLKFHLVDLWKPSSSDIKVIEDDWKIIRNRVMKGEAHLISEGDTMFLGAATKGSNSSQVTFQPFSNIRPKTRAFSLKPSYVNSIIDEILFKRNLYLVNRNKQRSFSNENIYNFILESLEDSIGLTLEELMYKYNILRTRTAKHFLNLATNDVIDKIFGSKDIKTESFSKANIDVKVILLNPDGIPRESMSFEQINFDEIIDETWEESEIRSKFETIKHLWVVYRSKKSYKKQGDVSLNDIVLDSIFYWNMPIEDLESDYRLLWEDTCSKVKNGEFNSFIKAKENRVGHIRPKGRNKADVQLTKYGPQEKKCFWLNNTYVAEEVKRVMKLKSETLDF